MKFETVLEKVRKMAASVAFTIGKLKVDGDVGKALEFSKLIKK